MKKNVRLRITALQRDETGQDETISLESDGIYGDNGKFKYVSYEETELSGLSGTTTTVRMYPDRCVLTRTGSFMQRIEYIPGKETRAGYETPAGTIPVTVVTKKLEDSLTDEGGEFRLVYEVEVTGLFIHLNEMIIRTWEEP
ncbi:MAG: DUF1934 domain-containing protein [Dialister sp.]|nr:DUF1934 domain-containing protein [Dialister sp.]